MSPTENIEPYANDFAGSLKQILSAYALESDLRIDLAAELCNCSRRTLQRKLLESGTRYSEVTDQVRFKVASRILLDPDMKI